MKRLTPAKEKKLLAQLEGLVLDDERKPNVIAHYENDPTFLPNIIRGFKLESKVSPETLLDVKKAVRSAYTTTYIIVKLLLKQKILIVEPTNQIAIDTIRKAVEIYIEMTGDNSVTLRMIPSNKEGCKRHKPDPEFHRLSKTPRCSKCNVPACERKKGEINFQTFLDNESDYCIIQTMFYERKACRDVNLPYSPDIVVITYDKLKLLLNKAYEGERLELFSSLIENRECVLFDEFGRFILNNSSVVMITEETKLKDGIKSTDFKKEIIKIGKFIEDNIDEINLDEDGDRGSRNAVKLIDFLSEFFNPLMVYYPQLIAHAPPTIHVNPLAGEQVRIPPMYGQPAQSLDKNMALQNHMNMYLNIIKKLDINTEGGRHMDYLATLIEVLTDDKFVVKEHKITDYGNGYVDDSNPMKPVTVYPDTEMLVITKNNREILELFGRFMLTHPKMELTISDATMPYIDLDDLFEKLNFQMGGRKHLKVLYGDPAGTNDKLMMMQYKPEKWKKFSSKDFIKDDDYAEYFCKILDRISEKIDMGDAFIIVPNIIIHDYIVNHFGDFAVSSEDKTTPADDKLVVTYFNSPMSRGVECDRRICISLGLAWKPIEAFKAIVLGQGHLYVYANSRLKEYAKNAGMTLKQFKKLLDDFFYPKHSNQIYQLSQQSIDPKLKEWFDDTWKALGIGAMCQDTIQGVERCKDPRGEVLSLIVFVGAPDDDIKQIINFGATEYNEIGEVSFASKDLKIKQCHHRQMTDLGDITRYLKGEKLEDHDYGYDKNLTNAISDSIRNNHGKSITQSYVYANLMRNLNIHHGSEDHHNGYLVGMIHVLRAQMEGKGLELTDEGNQYLSDYLFSMKKNVDLKFIELSTIEKDVLKILYSTFKTKKTEYNWKNASNNDLVILKEDFTKAMNYIFDNDILKGSNWSIKISARNTKTIYKDIA